MRHAKLATGGQPNGSSGTIPSSDGSPRVHSCGFTENVCLYLYLSPSIAEGIPSLQRDLARASFGSLFLYHSCPKELTSLLSSAIIEDINSMCKAGSASMAYFYCDFKDNYKQSRLDMIPSLLTQLSAQSNGCRDILSRLYSAHNRGAQMPTGSILTECLKEMLSLLGQSAVYIIIDAIDECPDIPGVPSPREDTLELLKELIELRLPNLRLCVTSRPEIGIQAVLVPLLSHRVSLHDESGQKKDIVDYVSAIVGSDQRFERWRDEDKCLVIKTLTERAEGMSVPVVQSYADSIVQIIFYLGSGGCPASWICSVTVSHRVCAVSWMNYPEVWTRHTSGY
jgi:hypothetical protein